MPAITKDSEWIRRPFMAIKNSQSLEDAKAASTFTTASVKFVDTSPGGNFSLNNPPQHSPLADPRVKGRLEGSAIDSSRGLGLSYSERIDDNSHLIYMRFGHASFSSMTGFVNNLFNYEASLMANTGRRPGFFYAAGQATGIVTALPFLGYIMFAKGISLVYSAIAGGGFSSNYMSVKPAMYEFWGAVSWVYNSIGVNKELVWPYTANDPQAISNSEVGKSMSNLAPGIIGTNGLVDVFAMVLRTQRLANENRKSILQIIDQAGDSIEDIHDKLKEYSTKPIDTSNQTVSYEKYMNLYSALDSNTATTSDGEKRQDVLGRAEYEQSWWESTKDIFTSFTNDLGSAINDGADWLCLRVSHQHEHTITFSNSTRPNPLADKVNGYQDKVKNANYMLAGGNLGDGPVLDLIKGVVDSGKDFVAGVADTWGVAGAAMLVSGAHADIPDIHDSSSFEAPATSYTIELDVPYSNPWSEYLHIFPTICALMAATLPLSTGKYSYTSPFYCELYDKSRAQIRRGIVTDLTITRGTHEIGMTNDRRQLGYKIDFTVADLNPAMHMPLDPNDSVWDGDSAMSDLLASLSSTDMYTQFYQYPKLKLKMRKAAVSATQALSEHKLAMGLADSVSGRIIRSVARSASLR